MPLTDRCLLTERPHPARLGGVQRLYRIGDLGLSLVNSPMLHSYPFSWEAAVIKFSEPLDHCDFDLVYDTPLTDDVVVFSTEDEANDFIHRALDWMEARDAVTT